MEDLPVLMDSTLAMRNDLGYKSGSKNNRISRLENRYKKNMELAELRTSVQQLEARIQQVRDWL